MRPSRTHERLGMAADNDLGRKPRPGSLALIVLAGFRPSARRGTFGDGSRRRLSRRHSASRRAVRLEVEFRRPRKVPITITPVGVHPFSAGSCTTLSFGSASLLDAVGLQPRDQRLVRAGVDLLLARLLELVELDDGRLRLPDPDVAPRLLRGGGLRGGGRRLVVLRRWLCCGRRFRCCGRRLCCGRRPWCGWRLGCRGLRLGAGGRRLGCCGRRLLGAVAFGAAAGGCCALAAFCCSASCVLADFCCSASWALAARSRSARCSASSR